MEISLDSRSVGQRAGLDSEAIRLEVMRAGGNIQTVADSHGVATNAIRYHVRRANRLHPLTYGQGAAEERAAMGTFVRASLTAFGINVPPADPATGTK